MANVKVVAGAGFGDEGKGLMTDYFCHQAELRNESCVVVMSNGGAQRGHTVTLLNGKSHVFQHFSSGTFAHAATYIPSIFILNPMQFVKEWGELEDLNSIPRVFMEYDCRWSTPFDMIINQIVEAAREENKHGSCGMGIWETVYRYSNSFCPYTLTQFNNLPYDNKVNYLRHIRDVYLPGRLKDLGVKDIPADWKDIVYSEGLIAHFIQDITFMCKVCTIATKTILNCFDNVIFENGQGLLLDEHNTFYGDNTTPSSTGIRNSIPYINSLNNPTNVEFCYVTRTYMTRHGRGRFETECKKELINTQMVDETNGYNPFQENLRYGELYIEGLNQRIENDMLNALMLNCDYTHSVAVTHTNEYQIDYSAIRNKLIYTSDSKTNDSVTLLK